MTDTLKKIKEELSILKYWFSEVYHDEQRAQEVDSLMEICDHERLNQLEQELINTSLEDEVVTAVHSVLKRFEPLNEVQFAKLIRILVGRTTISVSRKVAIYFLDKAFDYWGTIKIDNVWGGDDTHSHPIPEYRK